MGFDCGPREDEKGRCGVARGGFAFRGFDLFSRFESRSAAEDQRYAMVPLVTDPTDVDMDCLVRDS